MALCWSKLRESQSSILERNIATQSDSGECTCFWVAVSPAFRTLKLLDQTHRLNTKGDYKTMMITSTRCFFTHVTMVIYPLLYQDTLSTRSQTYETMFLKKQLDHFDEYRGIKTFCRYNEAVGAIRLHPLWGLLLISTPSAKSSSSSDDAQAV